MKTPKEIKEYRNQVLSVLKWAISNGHISEEQAQILKENILEIELDLYPKEMVVDENGWPQIKAEFIYGLPFDEWE